MAQSVYQRLGAVFAPERFSPDRRAALKAAAAAGAAAVLNSAGCATFNAAPGTRTGKRVVVIGAGFAGLACAHKLMAEGVDVRVFEARNRVGGRILSFNAAPGCGGEFIPGRNIEGGGELIGVNHTTWVALADHFKLPLVELSSDDGLKEPALWRGSPVDLARAAALWEQLDAAHATLNATARAVNADEPWRSSNAAAIDAVSLKPWLDGLHHTLPNLDELGHACMAMEFEANNGVTLDRQSLLANAASIKGGGVEKYWTDSETHRCAGGNQLLAVRLAAGLGDRVTLGLPVALVEQSPRGFTVTTADGRRHRCDEVVVAVPPSVWPRIRFEPGLPPRLRVQMGCNVKHLSHVKRRYWKDAGVSQYALIMGEDARACMTWDGTDAQGGAPPDACLTSFAGAAAAQRMRDDAPGERRSRIAAELEALFPGYGANLVATRFMDWPSEQWSGGSYSFPAPGQLTACGRTLRTGGEAWGVPGLRFAGEHCDPAFAGYMEAALRSGVRVANEITATAVHA